MRRAELISRFLIVAGLLLATGVPLWLRTHARLVHVSMAENGGWNPNTLRAEVGKPLELHLTSEDVVHGFAVGQMNMEGVDVMPGRVTDVTLMFDQPGTYTFYCTRWCGINHWRMRGTIEVSGAPANPVPVSVPLYVMLGLDIDAPHEATLLPDHQPSAFSGLALMSNLDISQFGNPDFYRANSPEEVFAGLNSTPLTSAERWDVVSYLWQSQRASQALANGRKLYAENCAACHGEDGAGNGVFADEIAQAGKGSQQTMMSSEEMRQNPADFTDPTRMLGASPAVLQGKILRGGMGTGMPMWGSIFTEEQIWDLVAYLYSYQFDYQK